MTSMLPPLFACIAIFSKAKADTCTLQTVCLRCDPGSAVLVMASNIGLKAANISATAWHTLQGNVLAEGEQRSVIEQLAGSWLRP